MHYQPYYTLQLFHSYYADNICPDVAIEPTPACQRLLQSYRLVLKPRLNGITLLVPLETAKKPVIPLDTSMVFSFLLQLKTPNFVKFTQLAPQYQPGQSLYAFTNHTYKKPGTLELKPNIIQRSVQPTDPSSLAGRCAAILATLSPHQRHTTFGLVNIHHNKSLATNFSQPTHFQITFTAKQQVWNYYLVANKGTQETTFSIKDKGAAITFEAAPIVAQDPVVTAIQDRFPNTQTIRFQSTQPIPCQQLAKPNLQLIKQGHTKPWLPHLPNPPNQSGTQVINLLEEL